MRLALILCDEPREPLLTKYGSYSRIFVEFFNPPSAEETTIIESFDLFRQRQLPTSPACFDGIIISGSVRSVNEPLQWIEQLLSFVRTYYSRTLEETTDESSSYSRMPPLLGICFGHQVICRAFEVPIVSSAAWELGWTQIDLSSPGHDLFGPSTQTRLISSHREEAARVPEGFLSLGGSVGCAIQGIYSASRGILGLQGHPEIEQPYIVELAERRWREGLIPPEVHAHVMETRDRPLDREALFRGITKFLRRHQREALSCANI